MTVLFFVRDEDLLKASHYKTITVPGHVHHGKWVDTYTKNALVSDDHDDAKVAAGQGSFYQKEAHKKAAVSVAGFHTMADAHKAAIVLHHATDLQTQASASAAVSGFKASMLAGKVPTASQYQAMVDAHSSVQGKVADTLAAKIGADQYEALFAQASAKAAGKKGAPAAAKASSPAAVAAPVAPSLASHDGDASKPLHVIPSDDPKAGYEVLVSAAQGGKFAVAVKDVDSGQTLPTVKLFDKESAALDHAFSLAAGKPSGAAPKADAPVVAPAAKVFVRAPTSVPAAPAQIPAASPGGVPGIQWDSHLLSAENSNAATHNKAVAKVKAMAEAGDHAGLQAFADAKAGAKQTYAKKQGKLAKDALEALKAPAGVPVSPVAAPVEAAAPAAAPDPHAAWKASMLAGVVPSPADHAAFMALPMAEKKGIFEDVKQALGGKGKVYALLNQANAAANAALAAEGPKDGDTKPVDASVAPSNPIDDWVEFNKKNWGNIKDLDDVEPFLASPGMAGPAALAAFGSGAFMEINEDPSLPASKALLGYISGLPAVAPSQKLHRVLGFGDQGAVDAYLAQLSPSLGKPGDQKKTVSSWTTKDPAAEGQSPMNNIALDLATQFGDHQVFLTLEAGHKSAKDVSFLYAKDGKSKPGGELLLPHGVKLDVVSVQKKGLVTHVSVREVQEGDTKPGAGGATLVLKDGRWHKYVDADESGEVPPVLVPVAEPSPSVNPHLAQFGPAASTPVPADVMAALDLMATYGSKFALESVVASNSQSPHVAAYAKKLLDAMATPAPASVPAPVPAKTVNVQASIYVFSEGSSHKFWAVSTHGGVMKTTYGKVGTKGQETNKTFGSAKLAEDAVKKLKAEKQAKGYAYNGGDAHAYTVPGEAAGPAPVAAAPVAGAQAVVKKLTNSQITDAVSAASGGKSSLMAPNVYSGAATNAALAGDANGVLGAFLNASDSDYSKTASQIKAVAVAMGIDVKSGGWVKGGPVAPSAAPVAPVAPVAQPSLAGLSAAQKKLAQIDPAMVAAWLDAPKGQAGPYSGFYDLVNKSTTIKFQKWATASKNYSGLGGSPLLASRFRSAALCSLFGKADHALTTGGELVKMGTPLVDGVEFVTDPAVVQKTLVFGDKSWVPAKAGPKEGDTKPGANGATLVLRDGHWVTLTKPVAVIKKLTPLEVSDAISKASGGIQVKFSTNDPGTAAKNAAKAGDAQGMLDAYQAALLNDIYPKTAKHIKAVAAAMGVDVGAGDWLQGAALDASAQAAPVIFTTTPPDVVTKSGALPVTSIDEWQKIGEKKGSNAGGTFRDKSGQEWYCKFPASEDHCKNELLASKLYKAAGIDAPTLKLVMQNGKMGIASKIVPGVSNVGAGIKNAQGAVQGFAVDAWLANHDAVGTGYDNLLQTKDGKAIRIDVGGALLFRAMGEPKGAMFGGVVGEMQSMVDAAKSQYGAAVFAGMTKDQINESVALVLDVPDDAILAMVAKFGPGNDLDKATLAAKLIARKSDLKAKYPEADALVNPPLPDPRKLPVSPDQLPMVPVFKGVSKVEAVNLANYLAAQAIYASALSGDFLALKKLKYQVVDKATGAVSEGVSFGDHPSSHIKQFFSAVVDYMEVLANPAAKKEKAWASDVFSDLGELSDAFKAHFYGITVGKVPANQRLGFWISLGQADAAADFMPSKVQYVSKADIKKGQASVAPLPDDLRGWMQDVKGSGSANNPYRAGLEQDNKGRSARKVLAQAYEHAVEFEEGTRISKGIDFPPEMMAQMQALQPGHVFQNPGSMCCSMNENWGWSGAATLTMIYAKGAKGLYNKGVGSHDAEGEITTIPGQRFMFLEKKANAKYGTEFVLLMLPPDETYVANINPPK
jgi:predicted DNA-binding WGR domain protein